MPAVQEEVTPTPEELRLLRAIGSSGSQKVAAHTLGIGYGALRMRLHRLYRRHDLHSDAEAVFRFRHYLLNGERAA